MSLIQREGTCDASLPSFVFAHLEWQPIDASKRSDLPILTYYCFSYIMTNRHVVGSGPFWGHCVFDNHEEVDCYPVYRDPIHDFGILRYDPKAIKYMHVDGLTLSPDLAKGAFDNTEADRREIGDKRTNLSVVF